MQLSCQRGKCHLLPVSNCFARPQDWKFTATGPHANTALRRHYALLHNTHASQAWNYKVIAAKTTRLDEGGFKCQCGWQGTLGRLLRHSCQARTTLGPLLRVKRKAEKTNDGSAPRKRRRSACGFPTALPGAPQTDEPSSAATVFCPDEIAKASRVVRDQLGASFLRALSVGSAVGHPAARRNRGVSDTCLNDLTIQISAMCRFSPLRLL